MRNIFIFILILGLGGVASGTTYYVSSSLGNDGNNGTTTSTPWKTMAKVNGQTFLPGDSILLKRGDVWNESLVPASSGAMGNPISFDAYGTGAAPNLTGYYAMPSTGWVLVTGNAWKAPVPAGFTTVNFCLFGSIWGQKVAASSSNLKGPWDFYLANGYLYVFSVGNPASYYPDGIVPMALSNVPVIHVNGKSWLTFQHLVVSWFDQYGVYVHGASDHLVFANMETDSMIPQGTQPLGFYVNESAPGPGDIKIYNAVAHMNYDGYRFDGAATAITMANDAGYGNRDGALVDNTGGVTYSTCHFYGSSLALAGSTDVLWTSGSGPTAGSGNVAMDTAPAVQAWQRYPAQVTLTVDDAGMTPGTDTYYSSTVLPIADAAGVPVGVAITVGYPLAQTEISEFQGWVNAGRDVTSHSMSHTYYTNTVALDIQYTGNGTAATLSIANKVLTITVTGAPDSVSYNLAQGQPQGTILGLEQALTGTGHFTATENPTCQGPYGTGCSAYTKEALLAQDLADVSGINVKSAVYAMQLDVTRLTTDEITLSRQWMTSHLTGLPATPVYVYPGGYETTAMQGIAAGVPYSGARGALKEDLGVKDTYASGFDVQNVTSFGVNPSWQGLQPSALNQKVQALVWKQMVWGVPWGIFWHLNELSGTEITNLIADLTNSGATIESNTGLVNSLMTGTLETGTAGNFYYKSRALSMGLDFRPTASSPVVDAGQNLGTAYQIDINGLNQNAYGNGWEIGAHAYVPYTSYGQAKASPNSHSSIGGQKQAPGTVALPQNWVNNTEYATRTANTVTFPSSGTGGSWTCGGTTYPAYTAGSATSMQQSINDAEDCRTRTGAGTKIVYPAGALYSSAQGITLPQSAGDISSNFIVLTSSSPLATGQTACSHGIQDNLSASSQPGIRNLGCDGSSMSYQLGTTVTPVSGAFTLANGTATNTSSYNDVAHMYTIEYTGNNQNGLITGAPDSNGVGPHHYAILNAEIRPLAGVTTTNAPVAIGTGGETAESQIPTHIHLAYDYIHADWGDAPVSGGVATGGPIGANSIANTIALSGCINCSVAYTYTDKSLRPGAEGHTVALKLAKQIKLVHNWFEGQGIGHLCGGWASLIPINSFVTCQDMEDRGNRYTYPYSWMQAWQAGYAANNLPVSGHSYSRKNAHEYKFSQRVVLDGNIFENVDDSGAQNGTIISFKTAQNSGGDPGDNYWTIQTDTTITNNIMRNSCNGPTLGDRSAAVGNGGGTSFGANNFRYVNNLLYHVSTGNPGCNANSFNSNPQYGFRQGGAVPGAQWLATASRNSAGTVATLTLTNTCCYGDWVSGTHYNANSMILPTSGNPGNYEYQSQSAGATAGTTEPTWDQTVGNTITDGAVIWTNVDKLPGGKQSTVSPGDPIQITGCSDSSFNTDPTQMGPLALAGTNPKALTVSYSNPGTANGSATGCVLSIGQGWPNFLYTANNSDFITPVVSPRTGGNDPNSSTLGGTNPLLMARNITFKNSIFAGGAGISSTFQEGTRTETKAYDPATLEFNNLVLVGRDQAVSCPGHSAGAGGFAACYTEYSSSHAASTPTTLYSPASIYCTGTDPTAESCLGVVGLMGQSSLPETLNDWHQYRLCHVGDAACSGKASPYAAGRPYDGSDGQDLGFSPTPIDTAQTATRYTCASSCGTEPYPDVVPVH